MSPSLRPLTKLEYRTATKHRALGVYRCAPYRVGAAVTTIYLITILVIRMIIVVVVVVVAVVADDIIVPTITFLLCTTLSCHGPKYHTHIFQTGWLVNDQSHWSLMLHHTAPSIAISNS
jgi:hypothetical protein